MSGHPVSNVLSSSTAVVSCVAITTIYLGTLYLIPADIRELPRENGTHIRWRLAATLVSSFIAPLPLAFLAPLHAKSSFTSLVGVSTTCNDMKSILWPLFAVIVLYSGVLVNVILDCFHFTHRIGRGGGGGDDDDDHDGTRSSSANLGTTSWIEKITCFFHLLGSRILSSCGFRRLGLKFRASAMLLSKNRTRSLSNNNKDEEEEDDMKEEENGESTEPPSSMELMQADNAKMAYIRNLLFAPITEEWVFRACTLPLLLLAGFSSVNSILVNLMIFALAHVHHYFSLLRLGYNPRMAALQIIGMLVYTGIFGALSGYFYVATWSLPSVILPHIYCNFMGVPPMDFLFQNNNSSGSGSDGALPFVSRILIAIGHIVGIYMFFVIAQGASASTEFSPCKFMLL